MRTRALAGSLFALLASIGAGASPHPISLDDLFALGSINSTEVSPDGEWAAVVIMRAATAGEIYGRTFYEMDVTRSDVWLISTRTGERRNVTQGAADASGYWCAKWSPDGQRVAMLSTRPAGDEPRGGDNIRLHVWDRRSGEIIRLSSDAMMTQTMGGSPLYRVDLQGSWPDADDGRCSQEENSPFLWLDDDSLLAVTLPAGSVSGLLDAYSRGLEHAGRTLRDLRSGREPTVTAVESGGEMPAAMTAVLRLMNADGSESREIASVPILPFEGTLQISVSPDRRSAALLASTGMIPPRGNLKFVYPYQSWVVDRKLGFVALEAGAPVRWVAPLPEAARYILDMQSWAPDGRAVAIRARASPAVLAHSMFEVSARDLSVSRLSPEGISVVASAAGDDLPRESTAMWAHGDSLLTRAVRAEDELSPMEWFSQRRSGEAGPRVDWWLLKRNAPAVNLTGSLRDVPQSLYPAADSDGAFLGLAEDELWRLNTRTGRAEMFAVKGMPAYGTVVWSGSSSATELVIAGESEAGDRSLSLVEIGRKTAKATPIVLPDADAELVEYVGQQSLVLFRGTTRAGTSLWAADANGGGSRKLLSLNEHMADVRLGKMMLVDYRGIDGESLKAGVIFPPDYHPERRYPTLFWVHAGATVRSLENSFFDAYQPGMYNMHIYAAKGYVVVMPSMPMKPDGVRKDDFIDLPKGVMPAVDRLIELGIADPDRLAVIGQSYGGYSTYALVTYTNRFKAAIAMAGLTDLVGLYGQFDPTARGYPGLEHQKSVNWALLDQGQIGLRAAPWEDLWHYLRNSPLYYADRVETPLLLIHGEQDIRGPMSQAEEFFYALYRQGKRARLLRYWGEDHGLRQSLANVRNIMDEIFAWLEMNMPEAATE